VEEGEEEGDGLGWNIGMSDEGEEWKEGKEGDLAMGTGEGIWKQSGIGWDGGIFLMGSHFSGFSWPQKVTFLGFFQYNIFPPFCFSFSWPDFAVANSFIVEKKQKNLFGIILKDL
jgi:hypothetical protein